MEGETIIKELKQHKNTKHGMKNTRIYQIWSDIKRRCFNKNSKPYPNYGGRGITVCNEWLDKENGFLNFYNWSIKNGYNDKLTIDRIDVNGNYEPNNCRWATYKVQENNRSNNRLIEIDGIIKTLSEWADFCGITVQGLSYRIDKMKFTGLEIIQPKIKNKNCYRKDK